MKRWLVIAFMVLPATFARESMAGVCQGKFANPITDICWSCLFPLTLGGTPIMTMGQEDTGNPDGFLCTCTNPLRIGIKTGFWEPARRVDVTRTPYCFVSLGGIKL
ncbi:TraU family protein, partial [Escherichia coli]|nr:TraU family protein [Escherichia coli]